jgi:hypothetical protein
MGPEIAYAPPISTTESADAEIIRTDRADSAIIAR